MAAFPYRVIDLSHPIHPISPIWPGDPKTEVIERANYHKDGYLLNEWRFGEHSGTHVGAPRHNYPDSLSIDRVPVNQLILPLRIIDVDAGSRPLVITRALIEKHEAEDGTVPSCCVALRTGWDSRWPDADRVYEQNADGDYLWPGFDADAVSWLANERGITAIATDAPDIGSGLDTDIDAGRRCAGEGLLHIENLANLSQLPVDGAFLVVAALPLVGGSGSPVRALGLIPSV
ncbi:MAG TPA: cyclase family protein [Bacteroidetes bacterium]|nr:kynurenine formamidase [bacterium BMS3Bbin04]HDO66512.1 cyclase family protein [Bacteroidota bacterium]HEX05637.1 cyclase family protein [Bacteroidota bacterium]